MDILITYRHIYVPEVVREPRMRFYTVPRLGAFMAVPLVYNSCLSEDALENAVTDYLECQKRREEQDKLVAEWEEEKQRERDEKERAGEAYEPEQKEWEDIQEKPFDTFEEKYVVCIDTLGQDRELTDEQKRFVLNTVRNYKEVWEKTEKDNLLRDRTRKLRIMEMDKEFLDNELSKQLEEEERHVEDMINARDDIFDDEMKDIISREVRLVFIARLFKDREDWNKNLMELT